MIKLTQKTLQKIFLELEEYNGMTEVRKRQIRSQLLDEEQKKIIKEIRYIKLGRNRAIKNIQEENDKMRREIVKLKAKYTRLQNEEEDKRDRLIKKVNEWRSRVMHISGLDSIILNKTSGGRVGYSPYELNILKDKCKEYNLIFNELLRGKVYTRAKQARIEAMIELRDAGITYKRIGDIFGKNHASIMYLYKKYKGTQK